MTAEMDKQNRRAARILRQFGRYVSEAAAQSSLDTPAIERRNPKAHKQIKARVGWRLLAKNGKGRK